MVERTQIYNDVANLHIKTMKEGFLPTLGPKFLTLMYRCIDEAEPTLIVEYDEIHWLVYFQVRWGRQAL